VDNVTEGDWLRWWRQRGERELSLILWAARDPIGCGVPPDEYTSYAPTIGRMLREGVRPSDIAKHLQEIRRARMEVPQPHPTADEDAADKIDSWYAEAWDDE
jgi:hypothetical protein